MKKVITIIAMLAFLMNVAIAQEGNKKAPAAKKTEKEQKAEKEKSEIKVHRAEDPNNSANYLEVPAEDPKGSKKEAATPTKKDGTPDKRYKENKEQKGPKKKDSTPKGKSETKVVRTEDPNNSANYIEVTAE